MNQYAKAIDELHEFFDREGISYAIIGGIALQYWGEPRFTRDIDVTVLVDLGKDEIILQKILSVFTPRISDALKFALQNRVCLVRSRDGIEIDISLGIPGYEEKMMGRTVECNLGGSYNVKICSAEDLIIHKAVAGRPQDLADIESIIMRQGEKLDEAYIRFWLDEFSLLLETKEVLERFENPWRRLLGEDE
ncbi:MAG: nucleotidyl transferase AbiEii/AbiGii toxin family protein [Candidatus Schekmanbacteria bacterium]|nr:nucleotidyl transferase AbiEii/AbiGii toxin family protein [Candidatus Schekmanbacteria bacterium]